MGKNLLVSLGDFFQAFRWPTYGLRDLDQLHFYLGFLVFFFLLFFYPEGIFEIVIEILEVYLHTKSSQSASFTSTSIPGRLKLIKKQLSTLFIHFNCCKSDFSFTNKIQHFFILFFLNSSWKWRCWRHLAPDKNVPKVGYRWKVLTQVFLSKKKKINNKLYLHSVILNKKLLSFGQ